MATFSKCFLMAATSLFVSCGVQKQSSHDEWMKNNGKIKVLATTPIVASLLKEVGGEHIDITSLIGEDLDPHSYEIVKGDSERINRADVVFASGLSLEHSASIRYQLEKHRNVLYIGDEVKKLYPEEVIYVDKQPDPHFWLDVYMWSHAVAPVVDRLSQVDPEHKAEYTTRGVLVQNSLLAKDKTMRELLLQIPVEKRYLVTVHDAFNYFVKRYFATEEERKSDTWWLRAASVQGIAPDEQISSVAIAKVVNHVLEYNIPVLFPEKNLSKDSLNKVIEACRKQGKQVRLADDALYSDTMGGLTYLEMMNYNTTVVKDNL